MVGNIYKCFIQNIITISLLFFLKVTAQDSEIKTIYILMATPIRETTFKYFTLGSKSFTDRNCTFDNCFITENRTLLSDITEYDVVLFNAKSLKRNEIYLPPSRSINQKYLLSSSEASVNYPLTKRYDCFFNWTWSYILDSDIPSPFLVIRNESDEIIGPKVDMHWMDIKEMDPISNYVKYKLRNKRLAAAWIVPKCDTKSKQALFVQQLRTALIQYELTVDIFGECGTVKCLHRFAQTCHALIENYYYFYLSFENSVSFDYVTDTLLIALHHFAVPVVYGGANYTRFMPDGMYLNALALGPERLAQKMNDIIRNQNLYYDMFRWRGYYSYHAADENPSSDAICMLCAHMNENKNVKQISMYPDMVRWYNECKDWPKDPGDDQSPENMIETAPDTLYEDEPEIVFFQ